MHPGNTPTGRPGQGNTPFPAPTRRDSRAAPDQARRLVTPTTPLTLDFSTFYGHVAVGGRLRNEGPDDLTLTLYYLDGSTSTHVVSYGGNDYRWTTEDALPTKAIVSVDTNSIGSTADLMAYGGLS